MGKFARPISAKSKLPDDHKLEGRPQLAEFTPSAAKPKSAKATSSADVSDEIKSPETLKIACK
ncbi:hypothetical protein PL263_02290 [Methylomonas sp. EFPC3]|uniref:hypothetical protein n=1 Tax=Methylomonas sp. EFPC3 TaxID=3021710 RepID=UPI00241608FA|nr:hypothetical protein [Methylomonas sp. EFPC3]WFP50867.1 hypothetical protein PL263_02290 [Methylomonas sp. EFPC3]